MQGNLDHWVILSNTSLFFKGERTASTMLCWFGMPSFWLKKTIFDVFIPPWNAKKYVTLQKWLQNFMQPLIFNCTKRYDPDPISTSISTLNSPPPLSQRSKDKRKMQSSGIDLDVKIVHIDVSLVVLTLTARWRNYLFKNFLL